MAIYPKTLAPSSAPPSAPPSGDTPVGAPPQPAPPAKQTPLPPSSPYSGKPPPDKALKGVTDRTTGDIGTVSSGTPDFMGTLTINGSSFPAFKGDINGPTIPGYKLVHIPGGSHNIYVSPENHAMVTQIINRLKGNQNQIRFTPNPNDK